MLFKYSKVYHLEMRERGMIAEVPKKVLDLEMRHLDYICSPKRCGVKVKREDILVCRDYAAALADEQQVKKKNASLKDNLLFIAG